MYTYITRVNTSIGDKYEPVYVMSILKSKMATI